jgi:hypothetical protein
MLDKGEPDDDEPLECPYCERVDGMLVVDGFRTRCKVCGGSGMITYKQWMEEEKKNEIAKKDSIEDAEDSIPF